MQRVPTNPFRVVRLGAVLVLLLAVPLLFSVFRTNSSTSGGDGIKNQSEAGFNKSRYSTDQPGSIWWVVNKNRPLPGGYAPPDLVVPNVPIRGNAGADERKVSKQITGPLEQMVAAAKAGGVNLLLASGYRSYNLQVSVYNQNVKQLGQAEADKVSARPGTSEHQTGLSLDIGAASRKCEIEACFATMAEGQWIAAHAHEYGFIIRYPDGKYAVTGYNYEPWHIRYVGPDLAAELKRTSIPTLEEFFSL